MRLRTIALVTALAACKNGPGKPPADAVAKVNGTTIKKADFDQEVDRTLARFKGPSGQVPPQLESRIKDSTLKKMIDDQLIRDKAKQLGISVPPEELATKFAEHKQRFGSDKAFTEFLTRTQSTEDQVKESIEMNLLKDRVLEKLATPPDVTDDEVSKYYDEHKAQYADAEQVHARHILARIEPPPPPTAGSPPPKPDDIKKAQEAAKKKARAKIEAAQKRLKKGDKFDAVAKDMSDDVTKNNGGDLGFFARGRMVPAFEETAFKLKPGETSGIVETTFGFHIIKVEEKKEAHQKTLDEVKEAIKASILARKRSDLRKDALKKIKDESKVEEYVKFDMPAPPMPHPAMGGPGAPHPGSMPVGMPVGMPPGMTPPHPMPPAPATPPAGTPPPAATPAPTPAK